MSSALRWCAGPRARCSARTRSGGVVQVVTRHGGAPRVEGAVEGGSLGTVAPVGRQPGGRAGRSAGARRPDAGQRRVHGHRPGHGRARSATTTCCRRTSRFGAGWRSASGRGRPRHGAAGIARARISRARSDRTRSARTPAWIACRAATTDPAGTARGGCSRSAGHRPAGHGCSASAGYLDQRQRLRRAPTGCPRAATRRAGGPRVDQHRPVALAAASAGGAWQRERATSTFITGDSDAAGPDRAAQRSAAFAELRRRPHAPVSLTAGAAGRADPARAPSARASTPTRPRPRSARTTTPP